MSGDRTTVGEAVASAAARLAASGADSPRLTAELFAERAFVLSRVQLLTHRDDLPGEAALSRFAEFVERRAAGEPTAYILGEREFFALPFIVTPDVLIPRPETERIVEEAQRLFAPETPLTFADFGTGSGALAVALAHEFPNARGLAVDISSGALAVADGNARLNGVAARIEFRLADFTRLELAPASLDLVVSNPPYVTEEEYVGLEREVRDHEPKLALVSPDRGLAHLRGLLPVAVRALRPGGALLCEIGSDQGEAAVSLARALESGLMDSAILRDDAGLDRVLFARRAGN